MLSRSRNNLASTIPCPNLTLPTDSLLESMASDYRKSSFSFRSHDSDKSDKGRKCSADTISRKSSFSTKKIVSLFKFYEKPPQMIVIEKWELLFELHYYHFLILRFLQNYRNSFFVFLDFWVFFAIVFIDFFPPGDSFYAKVLPFPITKKTCETQF